MRDYNSKWGPITTWLHFGHGGNDGLFLQSPSAEGNFYSVMESNRSSLAASVSEIDRSWFATSPSVALNACNCGTAQPPGATYWQSGFFGIGGQSLPRPVFAQALATHLGGYVRAHVANPGVKKSGMDFSGSQTGRPMQGLPSGFGSNYKGPVYMVSDGGGSMQWFTP